MADIEVPSIFDPGPDAAEEARLDAVADSEIEAGHLVPHAEVAKWLQSWGTPNRLPRPKPKTAKSKIE